jgi:NADPH-dependent 2,4-dienoyl-CoA reductase/sulfur reductase-like enzyme
VIVRLSYVEFGIEGGFTFDECLQVAQMAQQAGADAVRGYIAGWGMPDLSLVKDPAEIQAFLSLSMEEPPNSQAFFTDRIKKRVTIPVIAGSRITPEIGEMMLQENRADFIAIGRGLITDPDWAHKAASGRTDEIVPCIACMRCINSALTEANMQCSVNPAVSREREYEIKPAAKKKKVIVVGGGPGGMEAARVAALRGHRVTLYEKQPQLGGQLLLATVPPHKDNLAPLAGYLSTQMEKRGVKVNVGVEATPELIKKAKPDAVILATGASPIVPDIPGIGRSNVLTAEQVLKGQPVGEKVVVIGGELVGCETADFLAEKGKKVTITRRGPKMATLIGPGVREMLLGRLAALGVNMLTGVEYERITDKGLAITTKDGAKQTIEADTIVLAAGARPNRELLKALEGKVPEVYNIGDSAEPKKIADAIAEGYRVALKL